jgi:hypothetical protein
MRRLTGLAAVAASIVLTGYGVHAATGQLESVLTNGSDFTFNYGGTLASTEGVKSGSKLIIFDFAGYVPGSIKSTAADIVGSVENVSSGIPLSSGITDNPAIPNLAFTYTGPNSHTAAAPSGTHPAAQFRGLSASSTFGGVTPGSFAATSVNNTPFAPGTPILALGSVGVPGVLSVADVADAPVVAAAIPEVATWGLMLIGFGAVGFVMRNRRAAHISFA